MRLWHYQLLPYLPEAQFKGQLRELVAIMHDWRDKGQTNHILINRVMEYPRMDLLSYFLFYGTEYQKRNGKMPKCVEEFAAFADPTKWTAKPFRGWHDKQYLRICMANLYEKHIHGRGKSRITEEEWRRLEMGYTILTGEIYQI